MPGPILFCFAHPDDESFSGAGTAMKYAADGARTVLVTATFGERGKRGDPPVCAPEELAACREQELRRAAEIIGFDELHPLGYRDRELADVAPEDMRRRLVTLLRRVRPSVVVTFDPNGFNGHPDHVAISRFSVDACTAAADPRWEPGTGDPHTVARLLWTPLIGPWEAAAVESPGIHPGSDFVVDIAPWRERRVEALRAHRSQHLSVERYFLDQPYPDRVTAFDIWRQAWGPPLPRRPSGDIFEGI